MTVEFEGSAKVLWLYVMVGRGAGASAGKASLSLELTTNSEAAKGGEEDVEAMRIGDEGKEGGDTNSESAESLAVAVASPCSIAVAHCSRICALAWRQTSIVNLLGPEPVSP
jgi:hypothetical protein